LFLLSSILGHIYLVGLAYYKRETTSLELVAQSIVLSLYIGVVLLIGGTLLGGIWAAQSWGRFWDWDPKESWAFISICIYLLWIHAYRFGKIQHLGIAVGSILGFLAISFTWYGVNYILGTGLHSYGFGSGGNFYYYCYLFAELLFLAASVHMFRSDVIKNLDKKTPTC
ncbi:MAG: cytochrome c biogenesis protein CcsA, partial [Parachlamydiaceae bacterium]|nr:cytochrome c biogenesis protein CcsA [Parachlamydiaceae bacterium]